MSPLPWIASGDSIVTADGEICIANLETDGGYEAPSAERAANAALIVAAVNSHAALVAALEAAQSDFQNLTDSHGYDCSDAIDRVSEALKLAKGEAK